MKKKFLRFDTRQMRNEEWFNSFLEFKAFVSQFTPQALGIETLFALFLTLLQKADGLLEIIRKSPLTHDIKLLDALRDSAFRALKAAWKYALAAIEPQKREAAERLGIVFHHFGNLAARPYNEATGGIVNFVQELHGTYAADVALLELTEQVNRLDDANNAFENAVMQRNAEASARPDEKLLEVRHETNRCYLDMLDRIEAQALLEGNDRFDAFIRTLNANIERYKHIRHHKKDDGTASA
jgi:hypothetical protein